MTELQKEFKKILANIEKHLSNEQDVEYVKEQFFKAYTLFLDEVDELQQSTNKRIDAIAVKHQVVEAKLAQMESALEHIQKEIYEEDEYDADIICPYCGVEFTIEASGEEQESIVCPACNNEIDLEWHDGTHHDYDEDDDM